MNTRALYGVYDILFQFSSPSSQSCFTTNCSLVRKTDPPSANFPTSIFHVISSIMDPSALASGFSFCSSLLSRPLLFSSFAFLFFPSLSFFSLIPYHTLWIFTRVHVTISVRPSIRLKSLCFTSLFWCLELRG